MDQGVTVPGREWREHGGEDAREGCTATHAQRRKGTKRPRSPDQTQPAETAESS